MKSRDPITDFCWDWVYWCRTRGLYLLTRSHGPLAALQPSKTKGREPNARNDPDMQYFNMAVSALSDMEEHKGDFAAFSHYYLGPDKLVKVAASELGIGIRTYYDRVKRFGDRAFRMMPSIKAAHLALAPAAPAASNAED